MIGKTIYLRFDKICRQSNTSVNINIKLETRDVTHGSQRCATSVLADDKLSAGFTAFYFQTSAQKLASAPLVHP